MSQVLMRNVNVAVIQGSVTVEEDGTFTVVHKKPRSSKFLKSVYGPEAVICAKIGDTDSKAFIVVRQQDQAEVGVIENVARASFGLMVGTDSEGSEVYFNSADCVVTGDFEEEEPEAPAPKAKKGAAAKGKKAAEPEEEEEAEEEEEEEEEEDAKPAKKGASSSSKPARTGRRGRR